MAPGAATLEADYTHGWLYYLAMVWIVGLLLATGMVVFRKCRVSESRKYAWIPVCVFLGGFVLCVLSFANIYTFHKMPECFCLTFAAFWESGLQVGLLSSYGYYRDFFLESTVAAQIVDGEERTVYRAKGAPRLTGEQLRAAARDAVILDANARLRSAPVQDGRVYWVEDVSRINRMREQLAEINAQLSEENELIRAENELKRQRAQIEEKNRLMDAMIRLVQPQLLQIQRLLEDGNGQKLKRVCILGAYVKRRVNLALICERDAAVPVEELTHCVRESLTYALVRIHGDERPVGAAGDVMGVVVDLCLVAGELLVPVGGDAGVGRDSALFAGQRRPRSAQRNGGWNDLYAFCHAAVLPSLK